MSGLLLELERQADELGDRAPATLWLPPSAVSYAKADEAIEVASSVGMAVDDWQRLGLRTILATTEAGKWAAFEAGAQVARQNGKGGIIEVVLLAHLLAWGTRKIIYSAHEFKTALAALERLEELLAAEPDTARLVRAVSRSNGKEGITLRSGQTVSFRTRTKTGGRGLTGGLVVLDEAMILPETVIGALIPTMSALSVTGNPQALYLGSAVDEWIHEYGVPFARLRARGMSGDDAVAWLEWCANVPERADGEPVTPEDVTRAIASSPVAWRQANPAAGIRIAEEHIERERRSMPARTFAVERLGVGHWPAVEEEGATVIDLERWRELADPGAELADPLEIIFDVSPARTWAIVLAAGRRKADELVGVEVVAYAKGTAWLEDRLVALRDHRPAGFTCDEKGPAASMIPELRKRGVRVKPTTTDDMAQACGDFLDGVAKGLLRHSGDDAFESAIKAAAKRKLGDRFAWSRVGSEGDITPLVAATLGYWRVRTRRQRAKPAVVRR